MAGFVGNYKGVHHSYWIDRHLRMAIAHSKLERVVAKRIDQIIEASSTFNCLILDACSHCSFHSLQHNLNQTHSQRVRIHGSK
ncbi:hypothetical protein AHAS_Ahas15G0173600 [Arachis hypogaea]